MEVECLALKDLTSPRKSFGVTPGGKEEEEEEDWSQSEQKENLCLEKRRSTPLKTPETTAALLTNRKGATPDLVHITPIKHSSLTEPWTPTANLKMLISAASPDIRDREMKKVLFRPIENEKETLKSPEPVVEETEAEEYSQFEAAEEEDEMEKKPSRKQKSLGLLCQKFLALYPDYPPLDSPIWISLDKVATSLGVERRRIYDIVNVLESLMIVGRMAKNSYTWYGRRRLEAMLKELQCRGRQQGYHLQMELGTEARDCGASRDEDGDGDGGNATGNRKDKSLRIMSQKFVMLFLVSKTQTVTLDAAAKILIEDSQDSSSHSKYKTKVRRLYDIANVLTSLSLIKKVHVREERGRKPAFKWLGPVEFPNSVCSPVSAAEATITRQDLSRVKLSRHASFTITPTSVAVQRQVNSAPNSPRRETAALPNQPADYSRKTTVCRLQFGNTSDICTNSAPQTPDRSPLSGSCPQPTLLVPPPLHPNHMFASPQSSPSSAHCLAYLPSLSQPSVVMLYRAPDKTKQASDRLRSPGMDSGERRKRSSEGEEEGTLAKKGTTGLEKNTEVKAETQEKMECSETSKSPMMESSQPSHYLYVPNSAGLNSLNFFLSAGQSPSGLTLPPSSVPTLALPYVLVPSSSLSHYPLVASPQQQQSSDSQTKISFSLPGGVSPAHFMVGTGAYSRGTEMSIPTPSTPEQTRLYGSGTGMPHSLSVTTQEPLTPHSPKENMASASKAFFQTPATPVNVVSTGPSVRKRGSAQRRLDVGHPPTN